MISAIINRRLHALCSRIAESIEKRASAIGGPAQAAMLEIAAAVREAGR